MSWDALGGNPVPGDEDAILALADRFDTVRAGAEDVVRALKKVDSATDSTIWTGPASDSFRDLVADAGPALTRLVDSHGRACDALRVYAAALSAAQEAATRAETAAETAIADQDRARSLQHRAEADAAGCALRAAAAHQRWLAGQAQRPLALVDPTYGAQLDAYLHDVAAQRNHARDQEADARRRAAASSAAAKEAGNRRVAAGAAARQASHDRADAAQRLARVLHEAGAPGRSWRWMLDLTREVAKTSLDRLRNEAKDLARNTEIYHRAEKELRRWKKGFGHWRTEHHLDASTVVKAEKVLKTASRALFVLAAADGAKKQWDEDADRDPTMSTGERGARAAGAGVAVAGLNFVNDQISTRVGLMAGGAVTPVAGPVVGVAVGVVVGGAVSYGLGWAEDKTHVSDLVRHVGAGAGSVAYDAVTDIGETASEAVHGAADTAHGIWDQVTRWKW